MAHTTVHLVRHGEVDNPGKVLYGQAPGFPLSERGREMARTAAQHLAGGDGRARRAIVHLVSSPLMRARQTAEAIEREFGLTAIEDERVTEAANHFEGQVVTIPFLLKPRNLVHLRNPVRPSWGEPYEEIATRMRAAIGDARAHAEGQEAVIVTHQLPIWLTWLAAHGRGFIHDPRRRECALASITSLHFDGPRLSHASYVRTLT
ncbi:MAG: histidine phosphatase family protein [Micrococcales bacterium]|nr:histidine phosphatase family protein [Micrococcales bacterium]